MNRNTMSEYEEVIKNIIYKQMIKFMKEQNIVRLVYGTIVEVKNDKYKIDLGDTVISNINNKSGVELKKGDNVVLIDKIESNYANCFIAYKMG